jgi:hypothetical protein
MTNETRVAATLSSVQFATAPNGRRVAVIDAEDWEAFVEWLEDREDDEIIRAALQRLQQGPEASGAIPLEDALRDL